MNRTNIDWPGLGFSWNPIVGCANGCDYCYARKLNDRFRWIRNWDEPAFFPSRLNGPDKVKTPSTIFVGSMCDIFSRGVDHEWIYRMLETIRRNPHHTFMLLTKIPGMYWSFGWPENCWLGTTVESGSQWSRAEKLAGLPNNNKKYLSVEPLLGPFEPWQGFADFEFIIVGADKRPFQWWIDTLDRKVGFTRIWYKQNIIKYFPNLKNRNNEQDILQKLQRSVGG